MILLINFYKFSSLWFHGIFIGIINGVWNNKCGNGIFKEIRVGHNEMHGNVNKTQINAI